MAYRSRSQMRMRWLHNHDAVESVRMTEGIGRKAKYFVLRSYTYSVAEWLLENIKMLENLQPNRVGSRSSLRCFHASEHCDVLLMLYGFEDG